MKGRTNFNKFVEGILHYIFCRLTGRLCWSIYTTENVYIGKNCHIGRGVVMSENHPTIFDNWKNDFDESKGKKKIIIEDECFIGSNSVILCGVHLGKHTIVGAGSIVTKSFPKGYCIIYGNPAKLHKRLNNFPS